MELLKHVFHVQMQCALSYYYCYYLMPSMKLERESERVKSMHKLDICSSYVLCLCAATMKMDDLFCVSDEQITLEKIVISLFIVQEKTRRLH